MQGPSTAVPPRFYLISASRADHEVLIVPGSRAGNPFIALSNLGKFIT